MSDTEEKLKPCPFCGGEEISLLYRKWWAGWFVGCESEGCSFSPAAIAESKKDAVRIWNIRNKD